MHAAHHQFEFGREPLLADNVDRPVIADLPGRQGGNHTRAAGAETQNHLLAKVFRAHRIGCGQKGLIDPHRGGPGKS